MRGTVVVVAGWLAGCGPLRDSDADADAESEASTSGAPGSTADSGSDDATTGEPATCPINGSGILALCPPPDPPECSPLEQDCPEGQGCYPDPEGDFYCYLDESQPFMGHPGSACFVVPNGCDPGTFCALAWAVPGGCGWDTCCTPFCYLDEPNGCMTGQVCRPWYPEDVTPVFENLGLCVR